MNINYIKFINLKIFNIVKTCISLTLFVGLAGILGYLFQIMVGRLLSPDQFAKFSSFFSLLSISTAPLGGFMMAYSRQIANYKVSENFNLILFDYKKFNIILFCFVLLIMTIFFPFLEIIDSYFNIFNQLTFIMFFLIFFLMVTNQINTSVLQGLQMFGVIKTSTVLIVLFKILIVYLFLEFYQNDFLYSLIGFSISLILIWIYCFYHILKYVYKFLSDTSANVNKKISKNILKFKFIAYASFANLFLAFFGFVDMIVVNAYFDSLLSSNYAAASVLGKAILYLPGGVVLALFPMVAENDAKGESSLTIMITGLLVTLCLSTCLALAYFFFGHEIIHFFYDDKFPLAGDLLSIYGLAMIPISIIYVFEHYMVAKGRILFVWILAFFAPLMIAIINLWHPNLESIIVTIFVCGSLSIFVAVIWVVFELKLITIENFKL